MDVQILVVKGTEVTAVGMDYGVGELLVKNRNAVVVKWQGHKASTTAQGRAYQPSSHHVYEIIGDAKKPENAPDDEQRLLVQLIIYWSNRRRARASAPSVSEAVVDDAED